MRWSLHWGGPTFGHFLTHEGWETLSCSPFSEHSSGFRRQSGEEVMPGISIPPGMDSRIISEHNQRLYTVAQTDISVS